MRLSRHLSEQVFKIVNLEESESWLRAVDKAVGGLKWSPLGGKMNNVHSVEAASDSACALVERSTNAIDAVIDLPAEEKGETAPSPQKAAQKWLGVPIDGVSGLDTGGRQKLANNIQVINLESGDMEKPTIVIQDRGTGQHPDDFAMTLLSLGESNKKSKTHQMGVYNAGGAATYAFSSYTFIVSRRAPRLLNGRSDEIGVTVVRYNPLDPDKYKSGTYEYCVDPKGGILTLDVPDGEIPEIGFGTCIKHIAYELDSYCRAANEPKKSLHHLFHAALPDPPLPFWIEETRTQRFPALKGKTKERRVVAGLVARLRNKGTADYSDEREIKLGLENGSVMLRYFLLNEDEEPDAFVTPAQGLAFVYNGQRHGTLDRYWVKRNTGYNYIWNRLIILADGDGLTNQAKRQVFASTRESSKMSPLTQQILKRAIQELKDDDELEARDEEARQRTLAQATETASEKVTKLLADRIKAFIKGTSAGKGGGGKIRKTKKTQRRPSKPRSTDDSLMLDVPDSLGIINDPIRVRVGSTASIRIELNAKNGFLPKYSGALSVVVGKSLQDKVRTVSSGRLLGGQARISIQADTDTLVGSNDSVKVTLVVPELSVALFAQAKLEILAATDESESKDEGASPDVQITWIGRDGWEKQTPLWDENTVGDCNLARQDPSDPDAITRVDVVLNSAFRPYEAVIEGKSFGEAALRRFKAAYETPISWGLFMQRLAEEAIEKEVDENGRTYEVPDEYVKGERVRMGQAILFAIEPEAAAIIEESAA